jgi:fumarate hydratase class II
MVCAQVIGHDATIAWCAASGNFELNTMMTILAYDLLDSVQLLAAATGNFAERLVDGIEADRERIAALVENSLATATALAPVIGYDNAAAIVKEAYRSRRSVREVAREKSGLSEDELSKALDPARQAGD